MNIVEIRDLVKNYQLDTTVVPALRGVSLHIEEGDFLSIVGPSGSGKTTLLNIIGCIDEATSGSVRFGGEETTSLSDRARTELRLHRIGFIFQSFNLIPVLNVVENVEFPLLLQRGVSRRMARDRAMELVEAVGLDEHTRHRPGELSGGQRQRVAIARALATRPDLVLADEPTANLDSVTGEQILNLMRDLNHTRGTTFIFSTHDPQVLTYARRVVRVRDGLMAGEE
ncbi:MAG: ABC transporter ATP-binding protein [Fibrobacteria bacterium]|nr:ABC transporter ATP-binding protein [Fibrobacteria bacterium]